MDASKFNVFKLLGINLPPEKFMDGYAALGVWLVAVVFLIIAAFYANNPANESDQKNFNWFSWIVLLSLILGMFFTLRAVTY